MPAPRTATASPDRPLSSDVIGETLHAALDGHHTAESVLIIVPDHTRSAPLALLLGNVLDALHDAAAIDILIALGTHPPLAPSAIEALLGPDVMRRVRDRHVGEPPVHVDNHRWHDNDFLTTIGAITEDEIAEIAGPLWHESLRGDVPLRINRAVLEHDHVIIIGPTFPHEVVGFSGGAKYFFPGVSGPEMIDVSHWLGALGGVVNTIGHIDTPPRTLINRAARHIATPTTLIALVMHDTTDLDTLVIGELDATWRAAVHHSQRRHITTLATPKRLVLSAAMPMYDELWTAAKAMYKLEPVLADDAELIIYAPHLREVSRVHGRAIAEVGYHVLAYFLGQWDRFAHHPRAVLAHASHVRGAGSFTNGIEQPRVHVTLASQLSPDLCAALQLGYRDPASIDVAAWAAREDDDVLTVPQAGERLYRLAQEPPTGPPTGTPTEPPQRSPR